MSRFRFISFNSARRLNGFCDFFPSVLACLKKVLLPTTLKHYLLTLSTVKSKEFLAQINLRINFNVLGKKWFFV